jgi:hypothetical protein
MTCSDRLFVWGALLSVIVQGAVSPAYAQYTYDPSSADEQTPGIRYFGSAKDDRGVLLAGVTISIEIGGTTSFVFITDEQGRFHGNVPLTLAGSTPATITTKCFKAGYQFVRATRRSGLDAPKPYVQVDCVLHGAVSR